MSSIEITSRFRTIINRAIEMKFDKFVEDGLRVRKNDKLYKIFVCDEDEPDFFSLHYKGLWLKMIYRAEISDHECDKYDEEPLVLNSHNCECSKEVEYEIFITNDKGSAFYPRRLYSLKFMYDPTLSMKRALFLFNKIPDTIDLCQCGCLAVKDKWCSDCYIFRSEHPTDEHCAICHENEGVYVVTECKHYFHKHCLNELKEEKSYRNVKCPLCRTITGYLSIDR